MKGFLGVALLFCLAAEAYSLECYSCHSFDRNCTLNATVCNVTTHDTCRSLTVQETGLSLDHAYIVNGCGNCLGLVSFSSGTYSAFLHSICCSSDLCNDQLTPEKEDQTPNGLVCEGCFALTERGCNRSMAPVPCRGQQDQCIHASGTLHGVDTTTYVFKGCASHLVCQDPNALFTFGLEPSTGYYCCADQRCNLESRNLTFPTTPAPDTSLTTLPSAAPSPLLSSPLTHACFILSLLLGSL